MKATDVLTRALRAIGNVGSGEVPTADDMTTAFLSLNDMLDSWSTSKLFVYQLLEESFPLASGKGVYNIGPTGDFVTTRPTDISSAFVRLNNIDYPLTQLSNDAYSAISMKSGFTSIPEFYYYDTKAPNGELNLFPAPQVGLSIYLQSPQQLAQFADLVTDVILPPGYSEAIRFGVMPRLAAENLGTMNSEQAKLAEAAIERIKTLNSNVPVLRPGYSKGGNGRFNINRGY